MKYSFKNKDLIVETEGLSKIIKFPYKVYKIIDFEDCLIILLDPGANSGYNENVFCVSSNGEVLWQIQPKEHLENNSRYTGIKRNGNTASVYNWSGEEMILEPKTGKILKIFFEK